MHPSNPPDPRYPIGQLAYPHPEPALPDLAARQLAIAAIAELPARLSAALSNLDRHQLDTPYRDGGWTLRQLTHHVADSHLNAYTRLRLALTEDWPTIKPYHEAAWAELPDARTLPIELSLALLEPLHTRWVTLLNSLDVAAWRRGYLHPERGPTTLEKMTAEYAWHSAHHTAQVLALRARQAW